MSTPDENEPLLPAPENVDPTDSGAVAQVIKASATKAMAALAEIRTRVEGFDNQFQATERALAVIQPMIEQANQAFQDISDAAAKVLTDLQQSQLVEVPVRALSLALARANATLEAIVTLAKQYDAKLKLTESLVAAIAPHHRRVHAAITDASSYATAAAEAATSQLRGVHAVIAEQGLSSAATTMMAQLIASQAQALEERFHITENVSALAQQATSKAGQIAAKHEVHDKMVAASSVVKSAVANMEDQYALTERFAALDNRVTGGRMGGWAAAAFSRGLSMASGALEYASKLEAAAAEAEEGAQVEQSTEEPHTAEESPATEE